MTTLNILLTWLGNKDLENMQSDKGAAIVTLAIKSKIPFDKIVILSNKDEQLWPQFERYLKKQLAINQRPFHDIQVFKAHINSPIDYQSIAKTSEHWIAKLSDEAQTLSINLTSGTPTMTTLSVLIGKGKPNTHFLQTTPDNQLIEVDIPLDFIHTYVKSAAKNIASSASALSMHSTAFTALTAQSPAMKALIVKAQKIAAAEVPALILGETGTGKELMAHAIHKGSLRANKPIRIVNCGAFAQNLADSTLFGHKKGAFTGADKDYAGLFEQADGGTLFLDEVGELPLDIQVKLLRALQQGEINRLGDNKPIYLDVRIIAATHQDLQQQIAAGQFREDLFYRLAVGIIKMPALRERKQDIPKLVNQLISQINHVGSKHPQYQSKNICEKAIEFISNQAWPGNIRELWSTLNRACLWSDSSIITANDLADALLASHKPQQATDISMSLHDKVDIVQLTDDIQKNYVKAALKASGNVKKQATQMLGLKDHQTLTNWMKRLQIDIEK
ncbi:sigma-54 dependent transcriptional regulator [Shewanella sp. SM95]|uniref:sigma-54 interaction domain-containing protein n=1 Tax=Shewanella TaxID=22 RepID=UPI00295464C2|nr:sigma-54 dependent transcriptional regulator [Shewanella sp. SM95]